MNETARRVPTVDELAVQCANTPDGTLAQLAADHQRRAKEAQQYADRFRKLLKQRNRAKRRGMAVAL